MPDLHVITMALDRDGALRAAMSVHRAVRPWPTSHRIVWHHGPRDPSRQVVTARLNAEFAATPPDVWLFFVDDDNLLHPELPAALVQTVAANPDAEAVIVGMQYGPASYFPALPERMRPCSVDGGQLAIRASLAQTEPWPAGPMGDGLFIEALYRRVPERFAFVDRPLSFHNAQRWMSHA